MFWNDYSGSAAGISPIVQCYSKMIWDLNYALFALEKIDRFRLERFHTSNVNAERFQMVPEVMKMEKEGVLDQKNPVFFGILRVR